MPLMSYNEYQKFGHKTPYTFIISTSDQVLYYFGERHSFNPQDEQWKALKKFWSEFLAATASKKRMVFTEGGVRPFESDEKKAISEFGGMGLITSLANIEKIQVHSPEPSSIYERTELEKNFSRKEIQYYYFARLTYQWCKIQNPKPDFEVYIQRYLDRDKNTSEWLDVDFSIDAMKKIHKDIFNSDSDERNSQFLYSITNPVDKVDTVINKVSRRSGEIRDEFIAKEIQKYMAEGNSLFVQFGASHAVIQEPLLREMIS